VTVIGNEFVYKLRVLRSFIEIIAFIKGNKVRPLYRAGAQSGAICSVLH
jgi:hypothetical protein